MSVVKLDDHSKLCRQCRQVKPLTEFSPLKHGCLGVATQCKKCLAERHRVYRATHPHIIRQRNKLSNIKKREMRRRVITLLGGSCTRCGSTDYETLYIHHKNMDGKKDRNQRYSFYLRILNGQRMIEDLEIMCTTCNRVYHPRRQLNGKPCRLCGSSDTSKRGFSRPRVDGTRLQRYYCKQCGHSFQ